MNGAGIRVPRWLSAALVVVTIGFLVWLVARDRPSLDALADVDPADLAVIMLLQILYLVPESYRQEIVIESSSGTPIRSFHWFRIFVVGRFLNTLIPQSGNIYRAFRLRSDPGIAMSDFGGGMAAFVIMSVVASLLVSVPFVAWQSPSLMIGGLPAWLSLLIAAVILGAVPFVISFVARRRPDSSSEKSRLLTTAGRVGTATMTALRDVHLMGRFVVVWAVTLTVVVALYRSVFAAIDWDLSIGVAIAIFALLQASSFIVLTPGNLGIQELGMAALVALFGAPAAIGVLAAALIRVTGWIAIAIPAFAFGTGDIIRYLRSGPPEEA